MIGIRGLNILCMDTSSGHLLKFLFKKLHWLTEAFLTPPCKLQADDRRNHPWTRRTASVHCKLLYFKINLFRMVKNETKSI